MGRRRPKYPRGKLNAYDEGQLTCAVGVQDGTVIVSFGKPLAWLGLDYDTAKQLGELLLRRAEEIRN